MLVPRTAFLTCWLSRD